MWLPFALIAVSWVALRLPQPLPYASSNHLTYVGKHILYRTLRTATSHDASDVTVVVLNWSRLPNVVRIVQRLCGSDLNATVVVWNNNPVPVFHEPFGSTCLPGMLQIHNSPENVYFQARFHACARAKTPFCFIQDDDYFIYPEIIQLMRNRVAETNQSVYLLPPHEALSSALRVVRSGETLHTSFAWLGHGTMVLREDVVQFLALLKQLNASDEETKMADNYFAILKNREPEIWVDRGVELGGGQPFTVGTQGDERNDRHIRKAGVYLDHILQSEHDLPYMEKEHQRSNKNPVHVFSAPCLGSTCVFRTNIQLLPDAMVDDVTLASEMLREEKDNRRLMGAENIQRFLYFPPSHAVDGNPLSALNGLKTAKPGDFVELDTQSVLDEESVEMVFLVDADTKTILESSRFESSTNGQLWVTFNGALACLKAHGKALEPERALYECSILISDARSRYFRATIVGNIGDLSWMVYELWLRARV